MIQVIKSSKFDIWLRELKDIRAAARIQARLDRMAAGNPGDIKSVGNGISEMRIDYGPGYRVYFMRRGAMVIVLLCGGDKSTQTRDIAEATAIARQWEE